MEVNGISNASNTYSAYNTKPTTTAKKDVAVKEDAAVVYEGSKVDKVSKTDRAAIVAKLKADAEAKTAQFRSLVEKLISEQGGKASTLADLFRNANVDAETIAKAKEDVSENGYWGVKQTSERIFEFAKALSGGDEDKMNEMLEAFKKGFKEATKAWGEELPSICHETYDAVLDLFNNYKA